MYMLHKMSEVRGWTHEEMMSMNKCTFYRYYGYWYAEKLTEFRELEKQKKETDKNNRKNKQRNWKTL